MFHIVRCRLMPFEFGSQALLGLELLFRPETQEAAEHVQAEMTALLHSV